MSVSFVPMRLSGLSVVVPAFNEAESIRGMILEVVPVLDRVASEWEILVVDDGSRDGTSAEVERLGPQVRLLRHAENRGFGAAFLTGLGACRHEFVTLFPADAQFPPPDLVKLAAAVENCDVVLGVRSRRRDPAYRRANTLMFRWMLLFLFGIDVQDGTWVKLFRRKALMALEADVDGFAIDAQILARVCRKGYRVRQVRVGHRERTAGRAKGGDLRRVVRAAVDVLSVWLRESVR